MIGSRMGGRGTHVVQLTAPLAATQDDRGTSTSLPVTLV